MTNHEQALGAVDAGMEQTIAELENLIRIPSVAFDGYDHAHLTHSAEAVRALMTSTGIFDHVRIERVPIEPGSDILGQPAVIARRDAAPGKPTVLLYAHHDVQPWGDEALWNTPPFEPTVIGERLYGRGASDDKAGVISHVAALRVLEQVAPDSGLGIALFIEGEEEFGSRSFANFLATHRDTLAADAIVVADSDNWSTEIPSLTVALRGNVTFRVTITTMEHAVHSGMFGGAVVDGATAMIQTLSTLWDATGAVAVDGLVSVSREVPEKSENEVRADAGVLDGVALAGEGPVLERMWFGPSITVTGMDIPPVQQASNTIQPSMSAKISARVAPGQTAQEAFEALERHIRAHVPTGATVEITEVDTGNPFLVDTTGNAVATMKQAMADAWGHEPMEVGIGGSIPFIATLEQEFPKAEILVTGVEDPATMAHSPNESQHLGVLRNAIGSEALFLIRMAGGTQ
ncbi:dipeptidase [uncultured Agrococcus sp.]|uniref:dipeptidase n=1 Tax=uncultured Agrococcus sp. TaxID=382258 RepID=UPI0025D31DFF|nr:dipeptidase [uncultured Agrococcus sp.]